MTDRLGLVRRAAMRLADMANQFSDLVWEPHEFGNEAEEVVRDMSMLLITYGHTITRAEAEYEMACSGAIRSAFSYAQWPIVASAVVDELGSDILLLGDE